MLVLLTKVLVTAVIVVAISELGKRSSLAGALLASLPLTSLLALVWLYRDTGDAQQAAQHLLAGAAVAGVLRRVPGRGQGRLGVLAGDGHRHRGDAGGVRGAARRRPRAAAAAVRLGGLGAADVDIEVEVQHVLARAEPGVEGDRRVVAVVGLHEHHVGPAGA